jgi:hypothetical protein
MNWILNLQFDVFERTVNVFLDVVFEAISSSQQQLTILLISSIASSSIKVIDSNMVDKFFRSPIVLKMV